MNMDSRISVIPRLPLLLLLLVIVMAILPSSLAVDPTPVLHYDWKEPQEPSIRGGTRRRRRTATEEEHHGQAPHKHTDFYHARPNDLQKQFVSQTLGSNMVLQRDKPAIIWGHTQEKGVKVTVTLRKDKDTTKDQESFTKTTTSDATSGLWRMELPTQPASLHTYTIHIQSNHDQKAILNNVLFGDVYLCGGQSNIVLSMAAAAHGPQEAKRAAQEFPHIRLFTVGQETDAATPLPDLQTVQQPWTPASYTSLISSAEHPTYHYFSAMCWFFGTAVSTGLDHKVPLGLISNNWGASRIEVWQPANDYGEVAENWKGAELYNSMLVPYMVGPLQLTGFVWYHGEAHAQHAADAQRYKYHFPNMIQEWRRGFQQPEAFFGWIQLSTMCNKTAVAEVRDVQASTLFHEGIAGTKVAFATAADRGDACNVHSPAKQEVGQRLGKAALAVQYGHTNLHWKSPSYDKAVHQQHANNNHRISILVHLQDTTGQGLYMIDTPFSIDPNRPTLPPEMILHKVPPFSSCDEQWPGTCAGASVLLDHGFGWVNATIHIHNETTLEFVAKSTNLGEHHRSGGIHSNNGGSVKILATSYGWGALPLLTVYDKGTDLPVLPWKEFLHGDEME